MKGLILTGFSFSQEERMMKKQEKGDDAVSMIAFFLMRPEKSKADVNQRVPMYPPSQLIPNVFSISINTELSTPDFSAMYRISRFSSAEYSPSLWAIVRRLLINSLA